MGLSQKDTFKSNANMHNGRPSTHSTFKWSLMLLLQISPHIPQGAGEAQIWLLLSYYGRKTESNPQFEGKKKNPNKWFLFTPLELSSPASPRRQALFTGHSLCSNNSEHQRNRKKMHKVVAQSNMIKWCVVWRHSQHLSHPSPGCASPLLQERRHTHTHRFPFPEPCCENRSFILTVNS